VPRVLWLAWGSLALCLAAAWLVPASFAESGSAPVRAVFWLAFMGRTFSFHAGLFLLGFTLLAMLARCRRLALASLLTAAVLLTPWLRSLMPTTNALTAPTTPTLTVLSANLLRGTTISDALLDEIRRVSPDVILFQEYTPAHAATLALTLADDYPHRHEAMRDHAFGQAVFSRHPFLEPPIDAPHAALRTDPTTRFGGVVGVQNPHIRVVVPLADTPVVVQNIHFPPPTRPTYLAEQRRMNAWLIEDARRETRPFLAAGDFNSTPESLNARDLRAAGLTESFPAAATGRGATWPASGLFALAPGVRIDHLWHTPKLRCIHAEVCAPNDSDHHPIAATYVLR
jgi:endonuclease/exonuclease/phosphatase (EEP) superfamily protein YafD